MGITCDAAGGSNPMGQHRVWVARPWLQAVREAVAEGQGARPFYDAFRVFHSFLPEDMGTFHSNFPEILSYLPRLRPTRHVLT
jgi:hypothetical protein